MKSPKQLSALGHNTDPVCIMLVWTDLEEDLECLRKWLDGIEDHIHAQTTRNWPFEELEGALKDHKVNVHFLHFR